MQLILLTAQVDWNALSQGGFGAMVVTAVFAIIVQPLIKQMVNSNDKLSGAVLSLNKTISDGDRSISDSLKESEQRIIERFTATIEGDSIARTHISEIKESLKTLEDKIRQ